MPAGRPPFYKNSNDLQSKVDEYFEWIKGEKEVICDSDDDGNPVDRDIYTRRPEPPTITGLCLYLGFESRQSFHDYGEKAEFSYTIKKAKLRIEYEYEKALHSSRNPVAQIFPLKNLGWVDKTENHNHNVNQNIDVEIDEEKANRIAEKLYREV